MLSARQNFLETIKPDGHPDRLSDQYAGIKLMMATPILQFIRGTRRRGMEPTPDRFGTIILWPEKQVAAMPHVTKENKVLKDITKWREQVVFPDLKKECGDPELWKPVQEQRANMDPEEGLFMTYMPTGVFEQLHHLMGFEDTLTNFLLEPEAMMDLCNAIGKYRFEFMKMVVDYLHPEIMISHDDWGSKHQLFMSPDVFREFIKPQYVPIYKYMKDHNVIVMHHGDSHMEEIVEDMLELGVDVWQGALPENDIVRMQKLLAGRMTLMGGIDASVVDREDSTEEEIRAEIRRVCETYGPGGHFIPCITYGLPGCLYPHVDPIISDEIAKYNHEVYGV